MRKVKATLQKHSLYSLGVLRRWQGPVLKESGLDRITKKLYFKPSFIFFCGSMSGYLFHQPKGAPDSNKSCPEIISSQHDQATEYRPFDSDFFLSSKLKIF